MTSIARKLCSMLEIRCGGPGSLGHRKWLSLEPRYHLSRGRIADSGSAPAREFCVAQTHHLVTIEATSEPQECGHEAQQLRLERKLHAGSPYWSNHLVCAGPAAASMPPSKPPNWATAASPTSLPSWAVANEPSAVVSMNSANPPRFPWIAFAGKGGAQALSSICSGFTGGFPGRPARSHCGRPHA